VVGDRLRVRGADADVDHRDAAAVGADEVVRGHLRQARRRCAEIVAGPRRLAEGALDDVARLDEASYWPLPGPAAIAWWPRRTNSSM
jgi:hypothetical protein